MVPLNEYRHLNLRRQEEARLRREEIKEKICNTMLERGDFHLRLSDKEAVGLVGHGLRTVQRALSYFQKMGVWDIQKKRYKHPVYGWCTKRTLVLSPEYEIMLKNRRNE